MIDNLEFTDMYLIAALLSYGFEVSYQDRKNTNRQKFYFTDSDKTVYVKTLDGDVHQEVLSLEDMRLYFMSKRLLLPGSYPDILKGLKQDIISHKANNEE